MERLMNLLPKGLLLAYLVKLMTISASVSDMGIIAALSAMVAVQLHLEKNKQIQEVRELCLKENAEIKVAVNKQIEVLNQMAIELSKVKTQLEGVRLKEGFTQSTAFGQKRAV